MAEIEIIGVRARPPFPCLRPGLDIDRSRHRPVIKRINMSIYLNLSHKIGNFGNAIGESGYQMEQSLLIIKNGNVCLDDNAGTACSSRTIPMGAMEADGAVTGSAFDVAERFYVDDESIEAGDVVVLSGTRFDDSMSAGALKLNESELKAAMQELSIIDVAKVTEIDSNNKNNLNNNLENKNGQSSNAPGENAKESANPVTGNAINEITKTNNENPNNGNINQNNKIENKKQKLINKLNEKDDYIGGSTGKDKFLAAKAAVVKLTEIENDPNIIGVVSSDPAFIMGSGADLKNGKNVPVALIGRVPVKVSLENGEIKAGDPLTSAKRKGYAAKAVKSGRIVGYALEDYKIEANTDRILIYLQAGWYNPVNEPVQKSRVSEVNGSVVIRLG